MMNSIGRRDFLKTLAGLTAGVLGTSLPGVETQGFPLRRLGTTGESVTMLGVGGYHVGWTSEEKAKAVIEAALAGGVRFFDTAESYAAGGSEERYGKYLTPGHRDEIFLMTKSGARTAAEARDHLEGSLRRLKTESLDLWQIHSINSPKDVDDRLDQGVLEVFLEAKAEGRVRYIGFTGHADPEAHLRMLARTADHPVFDTCQMPVNPLDAAAERSFTREVLPLLVERGIAPLAMKTLADGRFFSKKNQHKWTTDDPVIPTRMQVADAINFAWSLPVSVLITGAENVEFLQEKMRLANEFHILSALQRQQLVEKLADLGDPGRVEYYKRS
ncbi:MAG: aldo/keto reductase [Kiritimatiellae bacterium]|jgi:aryl-alcohol dehydrogenase-like predicted oxidoreductase|nr:aldo/keto reductase [Kiritimatiellia bacterium]